MKKYLHIIAQASILALSLGGVAAPAFADDMNASQFVKMCDTDKDGMVSKDEMMKHVEKVWAKTDKEKKGKLDTKQVEFFLKELMKSGA